MRRGFLGAGGGALLLSLFLPWLALSVNACGFTRTATLSGLDFATSVGRLYAQLAAVFGASPNLHTHLEALAVAVGLIGLGGLAGLLGSGVGPVLAAAGLALWTYLISQLGQALQASSGVLTVAYRGGYYLAWGGVALSLAAFAAPPPHRREPGRDEAAAAAEPPPRFCTHCGRPLGEGDRFCGACGRPTG